MSGGGGGTSREDDWEQSMMVQLRSQNRKNVVAWPTLNPPGKDEMQNALPVEPRELLRGGGNMELFVLQPNPAPQIHYKGNC